MASFLPSSITLPRASRKIPRYQLKYLEIRYLLQTDTVELLFFKTQYFQELENFKTGFTAVGFSCERRNFLTGNVSLRAAQDFIQTIVSRENSRNQEVRRISNLLYKNEL